MSTFTAPHLSAPQVPGNVADLIARYQPGFSLAADFYTSPQIHDLDVDLIFGRYWLFCAVEPEIPEPGDYVVAEIGSSSVIVIRDDDGSVRALHNVCRHRGARVLDAGCGSVGNLVCPYHQWTYRPDGSLAFAGGTAPDFDRASYGLKQVHVRTLAGLIFVCLSDSPPVDFDEVARIVEPYLAPYRLGTLKVATQTDLVEGGNWKLVMENNRECLHREGGHPELLTAYFPFFATDEGSVPPRMRALYERYLQAQRDLQTSIETVGLPSGSHRQLDTRPTGFQITHLPLDGAGASFSPGGEPLSHKLIGDVEVPKLGDLSLHMQPNAWFHFLSDHAVVFRVLPLTADTAIVRTTWLVHADAVEGQDYDLDALTAVWNATNDQDRALVERTQRGVSDPAYVPGPYAANEGDVDAFIRWYVDRLSLELVGGGAVHEPSSAPIVPASAPVPQECWAARDEAVLVCDEVRDITHDVKSFFFVPRDGGAFRFEAGQFVTVHVDVDGTPMERCYSISSSPARTDRISITVKRVPGGPVSNWLHDNLAEGDSLVVTAPLGAFTLGDTEPAKCLFLSAGSGVTPVMSMTAMLADGHSATDVMFVHSARTPEDIVFRRELDALAYVAPNLRIAHVCEDDAPGERWEGHRGRLTAEMLRELVPDLDEREIYTCGPPPYMAAVRSILESLDVDLNRYHEESYVFAENAGTPVGFSDAAGTTSYVVEFVRSGVRVDCRHGQTILDAAAQAGMTPASNCEQGLCGTCMTTKLDGDVEMQHNGGIRPRDIDAGKILPCCSTPRSDVRLDS